MKNRYNYNGPSEFKPLSPWAYCGLSIVFAIPLIGLVINIACCFSNSNINLRSFARSSWCIFIIEFVLVAVFVALIFGLGLTSYFADIFSSVENIAGQYI